MREIAAVASARGVVLPPDAIAGATRRIDALPEDATASLHRALYATLLPLERRARDRLTAVVAPG